MRAIWPRPLLTLQNATGQLLDQFSEADLVIQPQDQGALFRVLIGEAGRPARVPWRRCSTGWLPVPCWSPLPLRGAGCTW